MRLQIEQAEGSICASSKCPCLMSLTLEEEKNSNIKSWLHQGVEDFDNGSRNRRNLAGKLEIKVSQVNRHRNSKHLTTKIYNRELKAEVGVSNHREKTLEKLFRKQTPCHCPQTIVNSQMKQIHLSSFIKSHDSAAIIKYAQLITTCVNVLKQFVFTGDLYSESVLNSALRKFPPELKTKWFFFPKSKGYYHADLSKCSEWLNEVAYVHDEMTVQFKPQSEKKCYSNTAKVKTSTFAAYEQNKSTSTSTKQFPLKNGDLEIWMCTTVIRNNEQI